MSVSSGDDSSVFECVAWGPGLVAEFRAGWEGWLEGACLAQLASNEDTAVCVAVLRAGQNGFLVVAEEGGIPCTGPWHPDGWANDYLWYNYFGCLVYMEPLQRAVLQFFGFF